MSTLINYLKPPGKWKQGIYQLESYEQYASIPALRSSELKNLRKTPAHYKAAHEYKSPISPVLQKSFDKGKAFDVLVLHGSEAFEKLVIIEPDLNKNTKAYKQWRAGLPADAVTLSAQEKDFIWQMYTCAMKKERFCEIFKGDGISHRVIVWQDNRTGLWCKAEIDWIKSDGTVVDLKSSADAGFWFFMRQASRLGYANQGAYYLDGLCQVTGIEHSRFQLAVVEVEPPFESQVFKVGDDQLLKAQLENEDRMETLAQCLESDNWPGYPDQILDLESGQYQFEDYQMDDDGTINIMGGF